MNTNIISNVNTTTTDTTTTSATENKTTTKSIAKKAARSAALGAAVTFAAETPFAIALAVSGDITPAGAAKALIVDAVLVGTACAGVSATISAFEALRTVHPNECTATVNNDGDPDED